MRFSTIFTVLAAGAMAFAGAVPEIVAKRSITDVQNTVADLSHKIDTITPKFGNCFDSTCSNEIVLEIVAAVDACTASLGPLSGGTATTALVTVVADVVTVSLGEFPGASLTSLTRCFRKSLSALTTTEPSVAAIALVCSISTPKSTFRSPFSCRWSSDCPFYWWSSSLLCGFFLSTNPLVPY